MSLIKKCTKRPIEVEYITFEDFIEYALKNPDTHTVEGVPWSIKFRGYAISHETDTCYLILTLEGTHNFTPDDVLIIGIKGELYPCKKDIFEATYSISSAL